MHGSEGLSAMESTSAASSLLRGLGDSSAGQVPCSVSQSGPPWVAAPSAPVSSCQQAPHFLLGLKSTFPTVLVPHQNMFPGPWQCFPCYPVHGRQGPAGEGRGRAIALGGSDHTSCPWTLLCVPRDWCREGAAPGVSGSRAAWPGAWW